MCTGSGSMECKTQDALQVAVSMTQVSHLFIRSARDISRISAIQACHHTRLAVMWNRTGSFCASVVGQASPMNQDAGDTCSASGLTPPSARKGRDHAASVLVHWDLPQQQQCLLHLPICELPQMIGLRRWSSAESAGNLENIDAE